MTVMTYFITLSEYWTLCDVLKIIKHIELIDLFKARTKSMHLSDILMNYR